MIMQLFLSIALVVAGITIFYLANKNLRKSKSEQEAHS